MSGEQQLVAAGGATLLGLYLWSSGGAHAVYDALSTPYDGKGSHPASVDDKAHAAVVVTGKSLAALAVATMIAGASDNAGRIMLTIVVGLLLVWALNTFGGADAPKYDRAPHAAPRSGPAPSTGRKPVTA